MHNLNFTLIAGVGEGAGLGFAVVGGGEGSGRVGRGVGNSGSAKESGLRVAVPSMFDEHPVSIAHTPSTTATTDRACITPAYAHWYLWDGSDSRTAPAPDELLLPRV